MLWAGIFRDLREQFGMWVVTAYLNTEFQTVSGKHEATQPKMQCKCLQQAEQFGVLWLVLFLVLLFLEQVKS